jgi:hypothetical protein
VLHVLRGGRSRSGGAGGGLLNTTVAMTAFVMVGVLVNLIFIILVAFRGVGTGSERRHGQRVDTEALVSAWLAKQ